MSDHSQALGMLLIEISELAGAAEDHGIVGHPPQDVIGPLIERARQLGVDVVSQATLADLHLAVELAAQAGDEQAVDGARSTATPRASELPARDEQGFAVPSPQVAPRSKTAPLHTDKAPISKA